MSFNWSLILHLGVLYGAIVLATFIRTKVAFFQKYLIPNPLLAGFILLPLYNFVLPRFGLEQLGLGEIAYHLLSISFVSLTLKKSPGKNNSRKEIVPMAMAFVFQFGLQAFIGLILTFMFIQTLIPDLFHSFGYLLALGFIQGPGPAFSIGQSWASFGVVDGGNIGLTFAAIGFIFCSFGGVFLINFGIRREWISRESVAFLLNRDLLSGVHPAGTDLPVGAYQTTESEAIDSFSLHIGLVFIGYLLAYLFLTALTWALSFLGDAGMQLAETFWGLNFIFAAVMGMLIKSVLTLTNQRHIIDNLTLNRISGFSVDLMVTSAIAAISLVVVTRYWLPITVMSVTGGALVLLSSIWYSSRVFKDHRFQRALLVFGVSTGTLSTGLALLRVVDPNFETPVATDYGYASGIIFLMMIPYILAINLPLQTYQSGNYLYFWLSVGISLIYLLLGTLYLGLRSGWGSLKISGSIWTVK
ncbi:sodium:glutamate symporter [Spirochaeta isovalerica]|uniref:ESS family glutamate:Na+ symporter n=1 Tax=Spirochaeta isovalerica TaxID=150 RepID=A0A841R842_9SPIO|nr:sodium:glutamate symporter [Spirochaeta isovalerica]MBB6480043.1 ESS family glutamate:Na+ symporter [Spirochaeta isovalerica]